MQITEFVAQLNWYTRHLHNCWQLLNGLFFHSRNDHKFITRQNRIFKGFFCLTLFPEIVNSNWYVMSLCKIIYHFLCWIFICSFCKIKRERKSEKRIYNDIKVVLMTDFVVIEALLLWFFTYTSSTQGKICIFLFHISSILFYLMFEIINDVNSLLPALLYNVFQFALPPFVYEYVFLLGLFLCICLPAFLLTCLSLHNWLYNQLILIFFLFDGTNNTYTRKNYNKRHHHKTIPIVTNEIQQITLNSYFIHVIQAYNNINRCFDDSEMVEIFINFLFYGLLSFLTCRTTTSCFLFHINGMFCDK